LLPDGLYLVELGAALGQFLSAQVFDAVKLGSPCVILTPTLG